MTKQPTHTPSRNAPCVCGSGKKSKHCCGAVPPVKEGSDRKPWLLVAGLVGVIAIAMYAVSVNRPSSTSDTATSASAGGSTPQAWQYDAAKNQYWDPSHKHWHDGRPPVSSENSSAPPPAAFKAPVVPPAQPPAARQAPAAGTGAPPKPGQYDAANNRHWDSAHNHWHDGPPPSQAPKQ